jgi:parallel beta-helix repeat protein
MKFKHFYLLLNLLLLSNYLFAQITPNGKSVSSSTGSDLDATTISAINYIVDNYYDVDVIQSSQANHGRFNCHFFAWNNTQGYGVWTQDYLWKNGQPSPLKWINYPTDYYTDQNYSQPSGYASYISTTSGDAEICVYTSGGTITHSARRLSYTSKLISKWGSMGIYKHDPYECPDGRWVYSPQYGWQQMSTYGTITAYYKINPIYKPVNDPGNRFTTIHDALNDAQSGSYVSVYLGNYILTQNETVPSSVTLYLQSGSNVSLDDYSITTTSGTITVESNATLNPDIRLQSGSAIKGLYPTIASAFTAATSGQWVHIRGGIHTFTNHFTISSGKGLKTMSGAQLKFPSGKYLYVYGSLIGNNTTYTRTSGTWGGIKYQSGSSGSLNGCTITNASRAVDLRSSVPINNCTISNSTYGIYCNGVSPNITNNTILNSSYGIYVYNGSPNLESNLVSGSKVYFNACNSYMYNNCLTGASGSFAFNLYASSPDLFYNTVSPSEAMITVYTNNGSDPWFGGYPGFGYNRLSNSCKSDGVIWANNSSNPILGYGDAGPYIGGNNTIIGPEIYPAAALDGASSIDAAYCWWGQYPAPPCYGDVSTHDALHSDPGGGSSLGKSVLLAGSASEDEPYVSDANSLWNIGMRHFCERRYQDAIPVFKNLIVKYPDSKYAHKALSLLLRIGRVHKKLDRMDLINELIGQIQDEEMTAVLKGRKVLQYRHAEQFAEAVELSKEIIAENPESIYECTALFDLFNLYQKDLDDSVSSGKFLAELRAKYPDDNLTIIARRDFGESVADGTIKKYAFPEPEAPVDVSPTEYSLKANYPNPFNPRTNIAFDLPEESHVTLIIYDISGREVVKLVDGNLHEGFRHAIWDGKDKSGNQVSSGVYLYSIRTSSGFKATKKMVLVR